jgi:putative transposase
MNPNRQGLPFPQCRQIRLRNYDYTWQGGYFVTIYTQDKQSLFDHIINSSMKLNTCGKIVESCWKDISLHYPEAKSEVFIVMPNHIHGIIIIQDFTRAGSKPAPTNKHALSEIIRGFKTYSSRRINEYRKSEGMSVWQRGYYDHVIRGEAECYQIGEYILFNPAKWETDCENPYATLMAQPFAFEYSKDRVDPLR